MLALLASMRPTPKNKSKRSPGRWRCHGKMTEAQVLEVVHLYEKHGWSCLRISRHLGIPLHWPEGVIYGGNGVRTVLIK